MSHATRTLIPQRVISPRQRLPPLSHSFSLAPSLLLSVFLSPPYLSLSLHYIPSLPLSLSLCLSVSLYVYPVLSPSSNPSILNFPFLAKCIFAIHDILVCNLALCLSIPFLFPSSFIELLTLPSSTNLLPLLFLSPATLLPLLLPQLPRCCRNNENQSGAQLAGIMLRLHKRRD